MKLFFGLGNPGTKYQSTRHNLGQNILLQFAQKHHLRLSEKSKLKSRVGESSKNIFAHSTGFMNESGIPLNLVARFYKISPDNIYVIHDDLDLPIGEWRLQFDRGSAGHNGIKSIIDHLGTQGFWRIRVGIGKPINHNILAEDYVLQPLPATEKTQIKSIIPEILDKIEQLIS
jgi:PTH1 family peptidyl-tRNA hydrolase